jgi:hypothetical protein
MLWLGGELGVRLMRMLLGKSSPIFFLMGGSRRGGRGRESDGG